MKDTICILCEVAHGRSPGKIHYQDTEISVFDNVLDWAPVMILFVPKAHISQSQLWQDKKFFNKISALAVDIGREMCPNGYRLLSNFGNDGLQTQEHGHLHLIGGKRLGFYVDF